MISTILVWRVQDTYKAAFDVDNYENFVRVQTDAAVRKLASMYPYDNFADEGHVEDITLRSSVNEVSEALEKEIDERLSIAGIEVLEARIGYLAYAQEIANAMLKRQQATAIVAARHKIVEGAVSMVEMAFSPYLYVIYFHIAAPFISRYLSGIALKSFNPFSSCKTRHVLSVLADH